MRIVIKGQHERIVKVICNRCKKEISISDTGMMLEDYLHVDKTWGYFSGQDGQRIAFDLCEECTGWLISEFKVPVYQEDVSELI